jgi:hypothetical protein
LWNLPCRWVKHPLCRSARGTYTRCARSPDLAPRHLRCMGAKSTTRGPVCGLLTTYTAIVCCVNSLLMPQGVRFVGGGQETTNRVARLLKTRHESADSAVRGPRPAHSGVGEVPVVPLGSRHLLTPGPSGRITHAPAARSFRFGLFAVSSDIRSRT